MADVRYALVGRYGWFTHASRLRSFEQIQATGLQPRNPGGFDNEVIELLGAGSANIVCLQPYPKERVLHLATNEQAFKMAVSRDDLPRGIGVDWSFGGWRQALCTKLREHPEWSIEQVFLAQVRCHESFVCYDEIPASALRVCPKHASDKPPHTWPRLLDATREDLHVLHPDVGGNVQV